MSGQISAFASATASVTTGAAGAARGVVSTPVGAVAALGVGAFAATHLAEVVVVAGGVAATALAVTAGAVAVQRHRGAWRPLGPALVSTSARLVEGHSCARCLAARLVHVPAAGVVMNPAGELAGLCAAHLSAARLMAPAAREIQPRGENR